MKVPKYSPRGKNANSFIRFWNFLKEDSWQSWVVSLVLLIVLIRFIFFPTLAFVTGSSLPLVVIESCSLYHESGFNDWWDEHGSWYESRGIDKAEFQEFSYKNGLNKGDIIFVWGRSGYEVGEIIIFEPNPESTAKHPIIHRIVEENPYETKGDHNAKQLIMDNNVEKIDETNIPEEKIIGKSVFKVPFLGWVKLVFFEIFDWFKLKFLDMPLQKPLGFCD
ncbi:MAG: hypothetical protein KJ600_03095 [Nanoarchaeota archaeon]|nr:hypothetical protein [Nanoarchaeota archaeon]